MMNYEFKEQDAYDFANHVRITARRKGDNLHFKTCPYCKSKDKETFAINIKTGQFNCLRNSCGVTGNFFTLARDFDFSLGSDIDSYYAAKKKYRTFKQKEIKPHDKAIEYMLSRGISEETTRKYEITVQKEHENILVFPFFDEKSNLQFIKYRKTDFDKLKDKNKEWCESNCKPILFGMKQCNDKFDRLVITEGQIDSMSVASSGIENAVSVPTGAKGFTWFPNCWDWITKFKEIVVFGDFENGHMSLLDEIKMRLKCIIKAVRFDDYKGCKDANEILQKYGIESVKHAVENAEILPMAHVIKASSVKKVDINAIEKCPTGIDSIDKTLCGGLPFGSLILVAGKRGDGKSTFANGLICSAINTGYNSMVYSGELTNEHVVSWIDMQLAGPQHAIAEQNSFYETYYRIGDDIKKQLSNWYDDSLYLYDANSTKRKTEKIDLVNIIDEATSRYGIRVVLIDNLMTAITLDPEHNSNKYDKQADFANDLAELARTKNLIIILVAHRRKTMFATTDENDEVSGASEISNAASVVINYNRGKGTEEEPFPEEDRLVTISKNRLTGKLNLKGQALHYDESSKRVYETYEELTKRYKWEVKEKTFNLYKYADSEPTPFDD